jgi:hypothetical protein
MVGALRDSIGDPRNMQLDAVSILICDVASSFFGGFWSRFTKVADSDGCNVAGYCADTSVAAASRPADVGTTPPCPAARDAAEARRRTQHLGRCPASGADGLYEARVTVREPTEGSKIAAGTLHEWHRYVRSAGNHELPFSGTASAISGTPSDDRSVSVAPTTFDQGGEAVETQISVGVQRVSSPRSEVGPSPSRGGFR